MRPLNADIQQFVKGTDKFDIAFMCTLFINLRKELPDSSLKELFAGLARCLKPSSSIYNGILGISTTPAGLHGKENIVRYLQEAGFAISEILVDNLLNAGGTMRGGYGIIGRGEGPMRWLPSLMGKRELRERIEGSRLGSIETETDAVPADMLGEFLEGMERVLLAALREFNPGMPNKGQMVVCTADKSQLLENLPSKRISLGLLP